MKLYLFTAIGSKGPMLHKLAVCDGDKEINERLERFVDESDRFKGVVEAITQVDGYRIIVEEKVSE